MTTGTTIALNPIESEAIRAALGEVCFGFRIADFEKIIGVSEDGARNLYNKLDKLDLSQGMRMTFSAEDLTVIRNAHRETLRELGVEEYSTRTGVGFSEAQSLARRIDELLQDEP